ncbi:hypothetical protein [Aquella oligotrophica]|uniref:Thaumarchaeal output domain-containing protein n=1 Tax=Aquella oligotrophica TaxID=2067065 RepID=A0A2I7N9J2_9NEIS|nr:hypothetical protein [Aquella oligotrophica]AUR53101.1 hypothetical protein CUN60_12645 [Aquella oligotrophica]
MFKVLVVGSIVIEHPELNVRQCLADTLPDKIEDYDFILIDGAEIQLGKLVTRLRADLGWLKPVVSINGKSIYANLEFAATANFFTEIKSLLVRYQQLDDLKLDDTYHRALKYLFLYPSEALIPLPGVFGAQLYTYLLQQLFQIDYGVINSIINELIELNLITDKKYIDNCFCCSLCQSELLKFSENCPHCNSSNIIESKFVHCFKCGYVANEIEFIVPEGLRCNNCRTKLKLIGDDYDHPLESSRCLNCQEIFIEGNSSALCISCGHLANDINKLPKHTYHAYQIKIGNDSKFLSYIKGETLYLFDKLNYAHKDYFLQMLEWLIRLYKRHSDEHFNMLVLELDLKNDDLDFRKLSQTFKMTLRTTDLYCNSGLGTVLFLFPKSSVIDGNIIKEKLMKSIMTTFSNAEKEPKLNAYAADQIVNLDFRELWFK